MEIQNIITLIDAVSKADIMNFEIEEGNFRLSMDKLTQRKEMIPMMASTASMIVPPKAPAPVAAAETIAAPKAAAPVQEAVKIPEANVKEIKSPIVGTYYSASGPDSDEFVRIGDRVSKGQTLCIIEAMKLMNDIESDYDGEIVEISVKNEQMVEYGQVLFKIKTA